MEFINGGVCAPKGFLASGISCGIRKKGKKDLALIVSEKMAAAAGVYTKNLVKGAPITVTRKHNENGYLRAIIVNSGNANTCNENGIEIAEEMCGLVEKYTGISSCDVAVASTGVIGQKLCIEPISAGMFGADANWGRVLCAIGYAGAEVEIDKVGVGFRSKAGEISVCKNGRGIEFSEEKAKELLSCDEIVIEVALGDGEASATAFGCDLTYDYVKINGDYRS